MADLRIFGRAIEEFLRLFLKSFGLKLRILLAFCQNLSTVEQTMEGKELMAGSCSQVRGNQIVKYLLFCCGYVDLSLNLSNYFVYLFLLAN